METLTRAQVRLVDELAIQTLGIPGVVLMENAGRNAADAAGRLLEERRARPVAGALVVVLCGGGNNGGDGYVVARHLHNRGARVAICTTKNASDLAGDALTNGLIAARMGLEIKPILTAEQLADAAGQWAQADLIVDALLGTGFTGAVKPHLAQVIQRCNQARWQGALVLAIDLPSGLDCDQGVPANATIEADLTVTFVAMKSGLLAESARPYVGQVLVADIGAPPELICRARAAT